MDDKEMKVYYISIVIKRMACYNIFTTYQLDIVLIKEWSLKIRKCGSTALPFTD